VKIGWLVWAFDDDDRPELYEDGTEPEWAFRKVRIVYAEVSK
jgi:hypothetical protein